MEDVLTSSNFCDWNNSQSPWSQGSCLFTHHIQTSCKDCWPNTLSQRWDDKTKQHFLFTIHIANHLKKLACLHLVPRASFAGIATELNIWTHISYGMPSAVDIVSLIWRIIARDFKMPCVNLMAILYNVQIVDASNYKAFAIKSKVKLVLCILYGNRKREKCNANFTFTNIQLRKLKGT